MVILFNHLIFAICYPTENTLVQIWNTPKGRFPLRSSLKANLIRHEELESFKWLKCVQRVYQTLIGLRSQSTRHSSIDQLSKNEWDCSTLLGCFKNVPPCTICWLQSNRLSDCDDLLTVNKEQFERASSTLWIEHVNTWQLYGVVWSWILRINLWCSLEFWFSWFFWAGSNKFDFLFARNNITINDNSNNVRTRNFIHCIK